jgi:hypothetical protein
VLPASWSRTSSVRVRPRRSSDVGWWPKTPAYAWCMRLSGTLSEQSQHRLCAHCARPCRLSSPGMAASVPPRLYRTLSRISVHDVKNVGSTARAQHTPRTAYTDDGCRTSDRSGDHCSFADDLSGRVSAGARSRRVASICRCCGSRGRARVLTSCWTGLPTGRAFIDGYSAAMEGAGYGQAGRRMRSATIGRPGIA